MKNMSTQIQNAIDTFTKDLSDLIQASARQVALDAIAKLQMGTTFQPPRAARKRTRKMAGAMDAPKEQTEERKITTALVHETLSASGGNVSEAARRLGISRSAVYKLRG